AGDLEAARARDERVRERAALVAEELRIDQRRREARAIDRDERRRGARAARVQLARDGVLAGAGLAGDEDIRIGPREAANLLDERPHHATVRDEAVRRHVSGRTRRRCAPRSPTAARGWRRRASRARTRAR